MTVLDYAIEIGQADSVELACDAGICLRSEYISRFELVKHRIPHERIASVLVGALSRERRELLRFALSELPREDIDGLGLQTDVLLDQKAFDVIEALKQRGITIPLAFEAIEPGSIYHWQGIDISIVQKLHDAGFHDVDSAHYGYTPIATIVPSGVLRLNDVELLLWFEKHGANFYAPLPAPDYYSCTRDDSLPSIHPITHRTAEAFGITASSAWLCEQDFLGGRDLLRNIFCVRRSGPL
ncbi:hypothetical protein M434DRAFT_191558 [Hypoxylon sp. CO27-5]|nr:hypothetical protein M434DRAFT_191558 [Hypoxylon sp. CO27-5]